MQEITFDKIAREKLKAGVDKVASAVRITMGPKGRVVVIEGQETVFTLDGVTVAQSIRELPDPIENMGANLVKSVAQKTNNEVGDSTTTATVLTQALLEEGLIGIENKLDPLIIKEAYETGSKIVISELRKHSRPVKNKQQMSDVATISSRDREIGNTIAEIYSELGPEALISVEESKTIGTHYEFVQGTQIDSGWLSPYFITNQDRSEAIVENPYVLLTTRQIMTANDIIPLLEKVYESESKSLVIVAKGFENEVLITLLKNKVTGTLKLLALKAPGLDEDQMSFLEDLAVLTDTDVLTENMDTQLSDVELKDLGRCKRIVSTKTFTRIINGAGTKSQIKKRLSVLKGMISHEKYQYRKDMLQQRYSRLSGGVAVIYTGSVSEIESKEKRYRIEDAVNSTKCAIEEGIVIGGGMALLNAARALLPHIKNEHNLSRRTGFSSLFIALAHPAYQILINAGHKADIVINKIEELNDPSIGFDSKTGDQTNMFHSGIIDPLKAERVALENSVSAVGMVLITGAVVNNIKEEKK